jgi:hypothetical protein
MTRPSHIQRQAPPKSEDGREVAIQAEAPPRRIVVQPDQIFPGDTPRRLPRRSFEGAVFRYVLISAAVVISVSILAMVATAFLGH